MVHQRSGIQGGCAVMVEFEVVQLLICLKAGICENRGHGWIYDQSFQLIDIGNH